MENETISGRAFGRAEGEAEKGGREETRIVLPGEVLADSMDGIAGRGTFREGSKIISKHVGLARTSGAIFSVVPLSGVYMPQEGDYIIGEVISVGASNWIINIRSPYDAFLSPYDIQEYVDKGEDLSKFYRKGDLIFAKVSRVNSQNYTFVTMKDPKGRRLQGGIVIEVSPAKVPRIIGKAGSMISMIKDKTNCFISVGQNGRVWIKGDKDLLVIEAIRKIEELAHTSGLTDKVDEFLTKRLVETENASKKGGNE